MRHLEKKSSCQSQVGEKERVQDTSFLHLCTQLYVKIEKTNTEVSPLRLGGTIGKRDGTFSQSADRKFKHVKTDQVSNKIPTYNHSV